MVMMMNDSAQDLEQLIRQYTQELLRFQKQYAAHMPPTVEPPASDRTTPPPLAEPDRDSASPSTDEPASDQPPVIPDDDILPDMTPLFDQSTAPPEDDERYPRFSMQDSPNDPADTTPLFGEDLAETDSPAMPAPGDAADPLENRDLMSDPDAETPQAFPPQEPPSAPREQTDFGQLQVQVYRAREALPIEGATVTIFAEDATGERTPFIVTTTNRSGFTPAITVPTVSASLSLVPGNEHPYSTYIVQVTAPGYFTVDDVYVPVYSGITSVQPAEMLPLPENYQGNTAVTYPTTAPNL